MNKKRSLLLRYNKSLSVQIDGGGGGGAAYSQQGRRYVSVDAQQHTKALHQALQEGNFAVRMDMSAKDDANHKRITVYSSPDKTNILKSFVISDPRFADEMKNAKIVQKNPSSVLPEVLKIHPIGKFVWYRNRFSHGITLSDLCKRTDLSYEFKKKLATELVHALATLHSEHYTHGDLKPENILVQVSNQPRRLQVQFIDVGSLKKSQQQQTLSSFSRGYLPIDPEHPFQVNFFHARKFSQQQRQVLDRYAMSRILSMLFSVSPEIDRFIKINLEQGRRLRQLVSAPKPSGGQNGVG